MRLSVAPALALLVALAGCSGAGTEAVSGVTPPVHESQFVRVGQYFVTGSHNEIGVGFDVQNRTSRPLLVRFSVALPPDHPLPEPYASFNEIAPVDSAAVWSQCSQAEEAILAGREHKRFDSCLFDRVAVGEVYDVSLSVLSEGVAVDSLNLRLDLAALQERGLR